MAWLILIVSGMFETVWAVALAKMEGFSNLAPLPWLLIGAVISMGGLGLALKSIPVGTGYAVWVAVGAVTTLIYSVATGAEALTVVKVLLVLGIIACVGGLNLVSEPVA
ncbi:MAG: SMR family transporter [Bowdeniella nasicola]|nr:SMR family transporter [Bowdeniella nasicola]